MKRVNPKTNKPFCYGDIREDGYVFVDFRLTRPLKKDGTYQENWLSPEKFKARNEWNNRNSEKWKCANAERVKQTSKKHQQENPEQYAAKTAKRRAAQLQRTPKWLDEDDFWWMEEIYHLALLRTEMLGVPHHVDHIIPLQGRNVCGLHVPSNLQVIPARENLKKSNRHPV